MTMKTNEYWVKMYLFTTGIVTMILIGAGLLRDRALDDVLASSFGWALLSAALYTGRRWYLHRTGAPCAVCVETAE
jgi:hypothetical protein